MSKYDPAIDKGIALLDAKVPDWCKKMQLDHLDMGSGNSCVLGQLFPSDSEEYRDGYAKGCHDLELRNPTECGFFMPMGRWREYPPLTRRWKQRIRQHCEAQSDA